jgi:hypothetical protein
MFERPGKKGIYATYTPVEGIPYFLQPRYDIPCEIAYRLVGLEVDGGRLKR